MSLSAVEALLLADCPPVWKVVLMVIARHGRGVNGNGGRPGLRRIARLAGIGRSTLVQILALLEAKGWLTWVKGSAKTHKANTYTIHFDKIPLLDWEETLPSPESELVQNLDQPYAEIRTSPEPELVQKEAKTSPESGPEAVTEGSTKNRSANASHSKSKFTECVRAIHDSWARLNPDLGFPWGKAEGNQLKLWLNKNSTVTLPQFEAMLRNREQSVINPAEQPLYWIAKIGNFASGPLNQYNKLLHSTATADPLHRMKFVNVEAAE